jgi:hypothetical protein
MNWPVKKQMYIAVEDIERAVIAESQRAERHQSENCGIGICGGLDGALMTQRDGLDSQDLDSQRKGIS